MSNRPITEDDLHALADGRLGASRRAEVESWLRDHPREAAAVGAWRAQNIRLHEAYDGLLDEASPSRFLARQPSAPRFPLMPVAASLASLPQRAAVAHAVYTPEIRHPVEVGRDQEAHLAAWLSKRLGAPIKPPQLGAAGFDLVGGRLLPGESGAVAQFMYQNEGGKRLTLYVGNGQKTNKETAFRYANEKGIGVFYWVDGTFGYALSGEESREKLLEIATLAYQQMAGRK